MAKTSIQNTPFFRLLDLQAETFTDERGFFREVMHWDQLETALGFPFRPVMLNHSLSAPGVIRALHAEHWNKLVYPVSGQMFAALVDIRPDSDTFGRIAEFNFSATDRHALFIPQGVANSICVIGNEPVNYIYLVDAYYTGQDTTAIAWNDPDLRINWPVLKPILSPRDKNNPTLRQLFPYKFP